MSFRLLPAVAGPFSILGVRGSCCFSASLFPVLKTGDTVVMRIFVPKNGQQWYHKSNAQKQSLDAKWFRFRERVLKTYGRRCMCCNRTDGSMQIDHIKPKSIYRSAWYDITNVQVLCRSCNMKKGLKVFDYRPTWALNNPEDQYVKAFRKRLVTALTSCGP